jgi:hypothetical protein
MIPCEDCLTLACCISFLESRRDKFFIEGPSEIKNMDSESLIILYYKCSILADFLTIKQNEQIAISKPRFMAILTFFDKHWAEGPYRKDEINWSIHPV